MIALIESPVGSDGDEEHPVMPAPLLDKVIGKTFIGSPTTPEFTKVLYARLGTPGFTLSVTELDIVPAEFVAETL